MRKENIEFTNPDQIINMGGPWVAELLINNIKILDNIIIDNYIENLDYYYFVKYFKISKKQKDNFFSIIQISRNNMKIKTSVEKFEKIYIDKIEDNILHYYDGFHNNAAIKNKLISFINF